MSEIVVDIKGLGLRGDITTHKFLGISDISFTFDIDTQHSEAEHYTKWPCLINFCAFHGNSSLPWYAWGWTLSRPKLYRELIYLLEIWGDGAQHNEADRYLKWPWVLQRLPIIKWLACPNACLCFYALLLQSCIFCLFAIIAWIMRY